MPPVAKSDMYVSLLENDPTSSLISNLSKQVPSLYFMKTSLIPHDVHFVNYGQRTRLQNGCPQTNV